jgi:integrase
MSTENELDLQGAFGDLLPWLFSDEIFHNVDDPEVRRQVAHRLQSEYGEPLMWQVCAALNRLIERGNAEDRFTFRLFPEPFWLPEPIWFSKSPATQIQSDAIGSVIDAVLEAIVADIENGRIKKKHQPRLLLLTLTLDDRITGQDLLRSILASGQPLSVGRRPFINVEISRLKNTPCIPVSYTTARVTGINYPVQGLPARGLGHLYRQALDWIDHHPRLGSAIRSQLPGSVSNYLAALKHHAAHNSIPALAYSRTTLTVGPSLPETAITRLLYDRPLRTSDTFEPSPNFDPEITDLVETETAAYHGTGLGQMDSRVRHILAHARYRDVHATPSDIAREIEKARNQESVGRLEDILAGWVIHMAHGKGRQKFRPGTIHSYYTAVSSLLSPHADQLPADITDKAAWGEFYQIISATSRPPSKAARAALIKCHQYMSSHLGAAPLSFDSNWQGPGNKIDNNIITPSEYRRALNLLDDAGRHSDLAAVAKIQLILGFRLGLRFAEAQRLEIRQLENAAAPWLEVRPNRWSSKLKSDPRRLPLMPLIPPGEREILHDWRQRRLASVDGDDTAALVESVNSGRVAPSDETAIREWVRAALVQSTGDPSIRYHHARHGFATWTFYRLILPLLDSRVLSGMAALEDEELTVTRSNDFREALLVQPPGQEALWLTSHLMGHASPETTRRTYIHLVDVMNLAETWTGRQLSPPRMQRLMGVSRSTAYEIHQRWGRSYGQRAMTDWPPETRSRQQLATLPVPPLQVTPLAVSAASRRMAALCYAAAQIGEHRESDEAHVDTIAERYGLAHAELASHLARLHQVQRRYRTRQGEPRFPARIDMPRAQVEREDLALWAERLTQAMSRGGVGEGMHWSRIVDICATTMARGRAYARLDSPADAYAYIIGLQETLGISAERFIITTAPVRNESDARWQRRRRDLARNTGVTKSQIQIRSGAPLAPDKAPAIEVSVQSRVDRGRKRRSGSEAYRALIHYWLVEAYTDRTTETP